MAASYINGLQSRGVAATIKHFVANDQEHERTAVNSVVSGRALREIYLYPYVSEFSPSAKKSFTCAKGSCYLKLLLSHGHL